MTLKIKKKQDQTTQETKSPKSVAAARTIRRLLIALAVILLGVTIFLFRYQLNTYSIKRAVYSLGFGSYNVNKFSQLPLSYDTALSPTFLTTRDLLVMATGNKLSISDLKGETVYSEDVQFLAPAIYSDDKQILIFDRGGRELRRFSGYSRTMSKTLDASITDARVNRFGEVIAVTGSKGYKSAITVFDAKSNEIYKRDFAERYVVCADISDSGKNFVTASIQAEGGDISSRLSFFKTSVKEPVKYIDLPGELVFTVDYKLDGNISVITDSAMYSFTGAGEVISKFDFSGRVLQYFDRSDSTQTALILNKNQIGINTNLVVLDSSAKKICDVYVGAEIIKLAGNSKRILLLAADRLLVYNIFGEQIETVTPPGDLRDVLLSRQYGPIAILIDKALPININ